MKRIPCRCSDPSTMVIMASNNESTSDKILGFACNSCAPAIVKEKKASPWFDPYSDFVWYQELKPEEVE